MRSFHFSVKSVFLQNWWSAWKCFRALASLVMLPLCVCGAVAAECDAKIFGVLLDWAPLVKWTVFCEVGDLNKTHFFRLRCKLL